MRLDGWLRSPVPAAAARRGWRWRSPAVWKNGSTERLAACRWQISPTRVIPEKLRETLQLPRLADQEPLDRVTSALAARPGLLVLDNFEQLVAPPITGFQGERAPVAAASADGSQIVRHLCERLPHLALLVTSRHPLELTGEQEFPLEPLPVPVIGGSGFGGGYSPSPRRTSPAARAWRYLFTERRGTDRISR